MKLLEFIEFLDLLPVGRNARWLRTPPTTEIGSAQPVVILSETKDLKARFFANEAQNDKIKNGCASRVEPSPGQERNPAYKSNISQNDEMKESSIRRVECPSLPAPRYCARVRHSAEANQASKTGGVRNKRGFRPTRLPGGGWRTRRAECPSLPVPRYCVRVRHSAEANHASKTGGVRNKSGFRPTGLNDEIEPVRRGFISLRKSPNEQTASGSGSLLLRKEDRASRVQPRNPAYRSNISQNDEMKERKTGGVRNKSGFRPTGLNDRIAGKHGGLPLPWLLCLMLLSFIVSPVAAQVPTTRLFFNPTPLQIDTTISPTGVVSLEVADGVDIFAFDLFVQYDPSLLRVSQVTLGDFLGEGLFCMDQVNDPGLVHYSCTRFGVDTGVSGSGVLLTLTFEALGKGGDTPLSLEGSELYDWPDALPVDLSLENGAVNVRPFSTYLPLILIANGQGMEAMP